MIANPASAGGGTGRRWPAVAAGLRAAGLDFDVAMTAARGQAAEISGRAVAEGRGMVVAAGGDGTVNEVANGFFNAGEPVATGRTVLGVLPMGTGGDFRRTLGIPTEPEAAAAVLAARRSRRLDAGRVTYQAHGGGHEVRHFVNIADAGIGGEVVARVNRGPRLVSGDITFNVAALRAILRWRNRPLRVDVDGDVRELVAQQVIVANCQYFGSGMWAAPTAIPDDGLLDIVVVGDLGLLENLRGMSEIRAGRHLEPGHPKISHRRGRRVEVSSSSSVLIDVDGEQPGRLPALFEVQPGAIDVVVP